MGGAPCPPATKAWMENVFGADQVNVGENYGCTECGNIATNGFIDHKFTHAEDCEVKLVDLPELGFLSTDQPHPRGEILAR